MTITQTVEIPVSRRITIDVPSEIPLGPAILAFTPAAELSGNNTRAVEDVRQLLQKEMTEQGTYSVPATAGDGWEAHVRELYAEP